MPDPLRLNLGCGIHRFHLKGWVNVDRLPSADVALDLAERALPADIDTLAPRDAIEWAIKAASASEWQPGMFRAWPWEHDSVGAIRADNLVEHLSGPEYIHLMNEAHRVLQPGGVFWWRVPDAAKWPAGAFRDPTHRLFFFRESLDYLEAGHQTHENYGKAMGLKPWKLLKAGSVCTNPQRGSWFLETEMTPA